MKNKEKNHYQILGIKKTATIGEIKVAYRKLIAKTHPDKNDNGENDAWRINLAYHTLKDPKRRAEYDRKLVAESVFYTSIGGVSLGEVAQNLDNLSLRFASQVRYRGRIVRQKVNDNLAQIRPIKTALYQKLTKSDEPLVLKVLAWQAMLGETVLFEWAGKSYKITLPQGTQAGALLKIVNDPAPPLMVQVVIVNPDGLTDAQKQAWETLKSLY